jgi:hypothetical protein
MTEEQPLDPRTQAALSELQGIIKQHYPEATFQVTRNQEAPEAIHLVATVDVEDRGDVLDAVMERMMALQIEQDLPIFVVPRRPRERMLAVRRALAQASGQKRFPPPLAPLF